jgi:predicted DNA-binding transcriptional regulator AlpA
MTTSTTNKPAALRLLMKDEVLELIGISYPCLWAWIRDGKFPPGRSIGHTKKGHVAWIASEVEAWIMSRPLRFPKGSKKVKEIA